MPVTKYKNGSAVAIRRKDASNVTFGFSFVLPRHLLPVEVLAMNCLNHILTGTTSSRIFGTARKMGLVYGIGSSVAANAHSSYWDFDGEVNEENAEALFDLIHDELLKVISGEVMEQDFETAKSYALGRYQMEAQTPAQIADFYAEGFFTSQRVVKYDSIPKLLESVDKEMLIKLAREFVHEGVKGFAAVSSVEKAVITGLDKKLNF